MTIVGTRPELIKMSRVIDMFDKHTNHIFVHTGQNFSFDAYATETFNDTQLAVNFMAQLVLSAHFLKIKFFKTFS